MEYHAHNFKDSSLLFFEEDVLVAILPANIKDYCLYAHGGLTFGDLFYNHQNDAALNAQIIASLKEFFNSHEIEKIIFKPLPKFLSSQSNLNMPIDISCYFNLQPKRQEINLVIPDSKLINVQQRRKRGYKKALEAQLKFGESENWLDFWQVLSKNLWERHNCYPVHTYREICYLRDRFPKNIKLFAATSHGKILAGTVVYFYPNKVAHCQYLANTPLGRKKGALDFVIFELQKYLKYEYKISLGVSTLRKTMGVNQGLYDWKAGFGAIPHLHEIQEIEVKNLRPQSNTFANKNTFIYVAH